MNTKLEDAETPKSFAALRHPGARMYLIGSCLAMMGDSIEHVISYWITRAWRLRHYLALAAFSAVFILGRCPRRPL